MLDNGLNPQHMGLCALAKDSSGVRRDLGFIMFSSNYSGSKGPRKMKVCIPEVKCDGSCEEYRPLFKEDQFINRFKQKNLDG